MQQKKRSCLTISRGSNHEKFHEEDACNRRCHICTVSHHLICASCTKNDRILARLSVQALSKTNLAGVLAVTVKVTAKTMQRYYKGELTGAECFEELGEQGTGMVASSVFTVVGQAAIPIPVVGGIIGSMLGYALATASYGALLDTQKQAALAHEERVRIEAECEEHIHLIRAYRLEVETLTREYLLAQQGEFHRAFDDLKEAFALGDVDGFIRGANAITQATGKEAQFETMDEFNALMNSDIAFKL